MRVRDIEELDNLAISRKLKKRWVGSGSSRVVYALSSRRVIKLAEGEAGIEQNAQEVKISEKYGHTGLLARVIWYHPEYRWIVAEKARKAHRIGLCPAHLTMSRRAGILDIEHIDNWGMIGKRLVLCDYGLNEDIWFVFYAQRRGYCCI